MPNGPRKRGIELLAPGGDLEAIKAAVLAGADAVYCGLDKLNARHRAANITLEQLGAVLTLAHEHHCRVYLTLNVMLVQSDLPVVLGILNRLARTTLDGIIVQDLGLLHLLTTHFPDLPAHASTQLTTHNAGQIRFLHRLGARRINLSRELSLQELAPLVRTAHREQLEVEAFVHGSHCVCFSGQCFISSALSGHSGNRGRCSQPCREPYVSPAGGQDYPLNLKDNWAYRDLARLWATGVDALKIEGRMKEAHYVYLVTRTYQRRLRQLQRGEPLVDESHLLRSVFNRGFTDGYLRGQIGPQMFAAHPRNRAADYLRRRHGADHSPTDGPSEPGQPGEQAATQAYDAIGAIRREVRQTIEQVPLRRKPLTILVRGLEGAPLQLTLRTADATLELASRAPLARQRRESTVPALDEGTLRQRFKALEQGEYELQRLELEQLQPGLFLPQQELTELRDQMVRALGASTRVVALDTIALGSAAAPQQDAPPPRLCVLLSSADDVRLLAPQTGVELLLELPSHLGDERQRLHQLLRDNERLVPWFPPILIGEDYSAAVELLQQLHPRRIVTDNTGLAHAAWRAGIPWLAGPGLHVASTLAMAALREAVGCGGAVVSTELGQSQLRRLERPAGFELYASIYHPMVLLTSRQCLLAQAEGCERTTVDRQCLAQCARRATLHRRDGATLLLHKRPGRYASLVQRHNVLNTELCGDLPQLFTGYLVDLRQIASQTRCSLDTPRLVRLFQRHLRGDPAAARRLHQALQPTSNAQYHRAI